MLAAPPILLMLGLLAQAERASPEVQPAPAPPAPEVAPSTPAPSPASAGPPLPEPASPFKLGFRAGADFSIAADITPKVGYDFSPFLQYEVFRLGQRLGLAARGEFTFNRFGKGASSSRGPGVNEWQNPNTTYFDFAALAIATLHLEPVLLWLGTGPGLTVTYYFLTYDPEHHPVDWSSTRLLLLGAVGIDVVVTDHLQVGVHGEYRAMVNRPTYVLVDGSSIKPLGDRLAMQAAVMYQF